MYEKCINKDNKKIPDFFTDLCYGRLLNSKKKTPIRPPFYEAMDS